MRALALLIGGVGQVLLDGAAVMYLWRWFVVPLGVPDIGFAHALGLSLLGSLLAYQFVPGADSSDLATKRIGRAIGMSGGALVIGWVWHCVM